MSKRASLHPKANSKTKSNTSPLAKVQRLTLFGSPQLLLPSEDVVAHDELLGRVCAAIKPVDIIDEMLIDDVVSLEWDVLRWRRLKSSLMRTHAFNALQQFLTTSLDYDQYWKFFEEDLKEILQDNLKDQSEDDAQTLARRCAQNEPDADDKVNQILAAIDLDIDAVLKIAKDRKAKELAQDYGPLLPCDQPPEYAARLLMRQNASFVLDLTIVVRTMKMILFGDRINTDAINQARNQLGSKTAFRTTMVPAE
jgi:hypothetical protein